MKKTHVKSLLLILSAPFLLGQVACSWSLMDTAPSQDEWAYAPYKKCTTSSAAPIADAVLAVAFLAGAAAGAAQVDGGDQAVGNLVWSGVMMGSAYTGQTWTTECAKYKRYMADKEKKREEEAQFLRERLNTPQGLQPAATGCTKDLDCKGYRICVKGECASAQEDAPEQ